jgi:hypothetical protein
LADGSFRDLLSATKLTKLKACVAVIFRSADGNGYLEAIQLGAFNAIRCSYCPIRLHTLAQPDARAAPHSGHQPRVCRDGYRPQSTNWLVRPERPQ